MKPLSKNPLTMHIAIVLVIKGLLIYLLWLMFFSDPVAKQLTRDTVANVIMGQITKTKE